jgi:hypothetical protein
MEMADLLPEAWLLEESKMEAHQKGSVTDILVWVQCFATFFSTLATAYLSNIREMMVYSATIVWCHHDYEGLSWVLYDQAY